MNRDNEILYDEEGDYYYIKPHPSNTDDWDEDIIDAWDWVLDEDIPFDLDDLKEFYEITDPNKNKDSDTLQADIRNFLQEKGIEDILREKGISY